MAWFAIINTATNALLSVGDVVADALPAGLSALPLASRPDFSSVQWDAPTRGFVPVPPTVWVNRIHDLLSDPAFADLQVAIAGLSAANKTALGTALVRFLGPGNLRRAAETPMTLS